MKLIAIKYVRFKNKKNEWSIEGKSINGESENWLTFEEINLIVGKNATGKSNTIQAIREIADLISGEKKIAQLIYKSFKYELHFENKRETIFYKLEVEDGEVKQETLEIGNIEKLNRKEGKLFYEEEKKMLSFQTDKDVLALARRDSKQQPFFEDIYNWGKSLNHYKFGGLLGKEYYLKDFKETDNDVKPNLKDTNKVTGILRVGINQHPDSFIPTILSDIQEIGYQINKIETNNLKYSSLDVLGLAVHENDLADYTDQREMSQGMFRAFSLLIQLNYSLLTGNPSCILIDDIGEGLDYDRSTSLINLIIKKVEGTDIQIIMTTNDRFIMNNVPLRYWAVINRIKNKSVFYNYKNSKETFDDFALTRLNNFEFLSTGFFEKGFDEFTKDVE